MFRKFKKIFKKKSKKKPALGLIFSDKQKQDLANECESPQTLLCSILQDVPKQLVVSPYGHIYNRPEITNWIRTHHNCPLTRQELKESDLIENEKLQAMANQIIEQQNEITKAIERMSQNEETSIRDRISVFNSFMLMVDEEAAQEIKNIFEQKAIQEIKNNAVLDINNHNHLAFWENHSSASYDNCVQVKDTVFNDYYRIPKLIHELMLAANLEYKTKDEFKAALDVIRHNQNLYMPRFSEHPFLAFASLFRPPAGSEICTVDDIEKLTYRR